MSSLKKYFQNKKILFISVQTFNLEVEIKKKLEELGARITYYDERPSNSNFIKGIIRIKRTLVENRINSYYKKILRDISSINFDYLFVNRGEVVPEFFLEKFRVTQPECQLVFFTWDSFANNPNPTKILKYFDRKFTFDSDDALKYEVKFRPLFFTENYQEIKGENSSTFKYDLLFLGTAHSDRYIISRKVINYCNQYGFVSFCFYFMHGRLVYLYKKLFDSSFRDFEYQRMSFKSLNSREIQELYRNSKVILDINHPGQNGLTMRTIEAVGAGKKLITTNSEVKKYCFYNPSNILIIDRENIQIPKDFFESGYLDVPDEVYNRLSIEGWLNCTFFEEEPNFWIMGIE